MINPDRFEWKPGDIVVKPPPPSGSPGRVIPLAILHP